MPFAPVTLEEFFHECYEDNSKEINTYQFMTITVNCSEKMKKQSPAVVHIDGTARVHTVSYDSNPMYYNLLKKLGEQTGIPVLLNTSFNIQEPIVRSPKDAIQTFLNSGIDLLVIGNYVCDLKWKDENLVK